MNQFLICEVSFSQFQNLFQPIHSSHLSSVHRSRFHTSETLTANHQQTNFSLPYCNSLDNVSRQLIVFYYSLSRSCCRSFITDHRHLPMPARLVIVMLLLTRAVNRSASTGQPSPRWFIPVGRLLVPRQYSDPLTVSFTQQTISASSRGRCDKLLNQTHRKVPSTPLSHSSRRLHAVRLVVRRGSVG